MKLINLIFLTIITTGILFFPFTKTLAWQCRVTTGTPVVNSNGFYCYVDGISGWNDLSYIPQCPDNTVMIGLNSYAPFVCFWACAPLVFSCS